MVTETNCGSGPGRNEAIDTVTHATRLTRNKAIFSQLFFDSVVKESKEYEPSKETNYTLPADNVILKILNP